MIYILNIDKIYRHIARFSSLIFALLLVHLPAFVQAQEDWENDGEIEDVEIEIVKDREINLPRANRNFEKIPPMTTGASTEELEYFFRPINFDLPGLKIRARPLRMKSERLSKTYGNYARAGFGNFVTPYFEAYLASKRSKEHMYGAHVNFLNSRNGPVDDSNSGSGMFDLDLFGKIFNENFTVSGDVGFRNRSYHFYGYDETDAEARENVDEQRFNNFFLKGAIENTDKQAKFQYLVGMQFDYLSDDFDATESEVQFDFRGRYTLGELTHAEVVSDIDLITQEDTQIEAETRTIFRVTPTVSFQYEGFRIKAGFNAVYENDTLGDSEELHFYPLAQASYDLTPSFQVYAGIRGDIVKNTLRQLTRENPFLRPNTPAYNQNKTFEFYGGIEGKLSSKLSFGAGLSAANYQNMYFFINDPADQARFQALYDEDNTGVFNVFGELGYNNEEKLRLGFRGDIFAYDTPEGIENAWHRPNYKLTFISSYNLYDKLLLGGDIYAIGGIQALENTTSETVDLDAVLDLNLKAEYLVSDQISVFLRFNNILGNEYELLYNYPSRALQFMVGASYSF